MRAATMKFHCEKQHDRSGQSYWCGEYRTLAGRLILVEANSLKEAIQALLIRIDVTVKTQALQGRLPQ